jgi:hypothetical protein
VESHGHSARYAEQFRSIGLEKKRIDNPLDESESFWCFELGVPVLFQYVETAPIPLRLKTPGNCIATVEIPLRNKILEKPFINSEKSDFWIDIPLFIGIVPIGKLSCNLLKDRPLLDSADLRESISRLSDIAQSIAPYLEFWRSQNIAGSLKKISANIALTASSDSLFSALDAMCADDLLCCEYADVLIESSDSCDDRRLILAWTNYLPMTDSIYLDSYSISNDAASPTVQVWKRNCSMRLHNLLDYDECQLLIWMSGEFSNWVSVWVR